MYRGSSGYNIRARILTTQVENTIDSFIPSFCNLALPLLVSSQLCLSLCFESDRIFTICNQRVVNVTLFASVGMKNCNNVKNLSVDKAYMETPLTTEEFIKSVELKGYFISFLGINSLTRFYVASLLKFPDHTHTHTHTHTHSSKQVISQSHRPLPTQHTTNTSFENPFSQRNSNLLSHQSGAAKLPLISNGHGDRQCCYSFVYICNYL